MQVEAISTLKPGLPLEERRKKSSWAMSWQLSSLRWRPVDGEPEPHHEAEAGSLSPDLSGSPRDTSAAEHRVLWEPIEEPSTVVWGGSGKASQGN